MGTSGTQSIAIQNTGTTNLVVNSASVSGTGYTVSGMNAPLTVAPGSSTALAVSFTPSSTGTAVGNVSLSSNAQASPAAVALTGNGVSIASQPLTITQGALPQATVGQPYSATLQASGGKPSYTWSLASGQLPAGLTLAASGVASGTPQAPGQSSVTVAVTDSSSPTPQTATMSATVTVGAAPLQISTTNLPSATVGTLFLALLAATGGTPPYQWSAASGSLPAGLMLTASSGQVTGTPTQAGSSSVSLEVTDATSATASASLPLTVDAGSSSGSPQAGCGSPDGLTLYDQSTCGNVGDPYEGKGAPQNPTPITACGVITPTSNGQVFQVKNNIGSSLSQACLSASYPQYAFVLDLGGYSVTGQVNIATNAGSGLTVLNGTLNCNISSPSDAGCIQIFTGGTAKAQLRVHHITAENQATGTSNVYVEWDSGQSTLSAGVPAVRVDHITSSLPAQPASGRAWNIYLNGSSAQGFEFDVQADNNRLDIGPEVGAGQGVDCYAVTCWAFNNYITLEENVAQSDTGRGLLCETDSGKPTVLGTCQFMHNLIDSENNRALRIRNVVNMNWQYNYIEHIRWEARVGAFHIGENDNTIEQQVGNVQNNTFQVNDGLPVYIADAYGVIISNNTVVCDPANPSCSPGTKTPAFAHLDNLHNYPGTVNATFQDNQPSISLLPSPQIFACGPGQCSAPAETATTSATICKSGVGGGGGNITTGMCN